jgi:hypothetical protein
MAFAGREIDTAPKLRNVASSIWPVVALAVGCSLVHGQNQATFPPPQSLRDVPHQPQTVTVLPPELRSRVDTAIVRYLEKASRRPGRIRGVVGTSDPITSTQPVEALSPEGWACSDNVTRLPFSLFPVDTIEIRPGDYLECSGEAAPDLTVRFEFGSFVIKGDWVEVRNGTVGFVYQRSGKGVPYVFRDGLWLEAEDPFRPVNARVSYSGSHLALTNGERQTISDITLEFVSQGGHHYRSHVPNLGPGKALDVLLVDFRDGAGARLDPEDNLDRLILYCEILESTDL